MLNIGSVLHCPPHSRCKHHTTLSMKAQNIYLTPGVEVLSLGAGIPGPRTKDYTKHAEPRPAQPGNPVYKVKSYPNTAAEPENVEPLNGKQRGVLDVDGPCLAGTAPPSRVLSDC